MEPRIQFAKTSDGVSIAHYAIGEGEPALVDMPVLMDSHLQLQWEAPELRRYQEMLAASRKLVRYDSRGAGLSDRAATNYSIETLMLDLEAVVDRLNLKTFALFAGLWWGPVAITYAVENPHRVSHLVLWNSWARTRDTASPQTRGLARLLEADWELYMETVARWAEGWTDTEVTRRLVARYREGLGPDVMRTFARAMRDVDVSDLLRLVQAPTLVLQRRQARVSNVDVARGLASGIPEARLAVLEGESSAPYVEPEPVVRAIDEFVGEASEGPVDRPSGMTAILFADIADSTALTERLGDGAFREKARGLDGALRTAIRERGGTPVEGKLLGDGVLAIFTSAREAIEAAVTCDEEGRHMGLPLHLGIHAGDVIREDNNVYGGAVNIASRIAGLSEAGEVLVSETVRSLARTSAGVTFEDRGEQQLKGVGEKVRVWAVREGE